MKKQLKILNPNRFFYIFIFYAFFTTTLFSTDAFAISEQEIQKDIRTYWILKNIQKKRERLLPNISNLHADKAWKDAFNKIQKLLVEKYLPYNRNNRNKNIYLRFYTATEKKHNQKKRDKMVNKFHADLKRQSKAREKISHNKANATKTLNTDKNIISTVEEHAEWIGWVGGWGYYCFNDCYFKIPA
jgi:hypothetical protein